MFRIPAFLIVTLLLFNAMPVSFAQENAMRTQAEADALRDIDHDMKKEWWFMSGLVGSSVGCAAGGAGGFLLPIGISSDANCISFISDDPLLNCISAGAILFGVLAVPAAIFIYPHKPSPPLERLLGKPPEYIEAYLQTYRSKTISLRKRLVTAGSLTSNLGIGAMLLLIDSN